MTDHTGIDEGQIEAALARPGRLTPSEARWHVASSLVLAVVVAVLWIVATPTRPLDPVTLGVCVVVMAVACRIEFDLPRGLTVPLQAVFVPMLLLLPPAA